MIEMTNLLLDDFITYYECDKFSTKVNSTFDHYIHACMEHLDKENTETVRRNPAEEDVMFPPTAYFPNTVKSAWDKSIHKHE